MIMKIPREITVGQLIGNSEAPPVDIRLGRILTIGPIRGYPLRIMHGDIQLLCGLPLRDPQTRVSRDGRQECGAFLLKPGQTVCLDTPKGQIEYRMELSPIVKVATSPAVRCEFCRTVLPGNSANYCRSTKLPGAVNNVLLCDDCAAAWGSSRPDQA
jgi:hypothetical protein